MTHEKLLNAAIESVAEACRVARFVQNEQDRVRKITKDDKSPVTVADFAVQAVIAMSLNRSLDGTHIVGEEHTKALRSPEQKDVLNSVLEAVRTIHPNVSSDEVLTAIDLCDHDATGSAYWALDPIDGTKGFLRGQQYAIALGRIEDGDVVLGVMGCPNLPANHSSPLDVADNTGVLYSAIKGSGAHVLSSVNNAQSETIQCALFDPSSPLRACESVEAAHSNQSESMRILQSLGAAGEPVRLDSQCKYAVVARGQADVYLRMPTKKGYVEKIWDHAAGMIIATEAGSIVSDITGTPLDFTHGRRLEANRGIICSIPGAHERIIEAIEKLGLGVPA